MDILFFIVIIGLGWYIYSRRYSFEDLEKTTKDNEDKLRKMVIEYIEAIKTDKVTGASKNDKTNAIKWQRARLDRYIKAHNDYLRLKERFKHDKRRKQIAKDWKDYLRVVERQINNKNFRETIVMYSNDDADRMDREDTKAQIEMEEIEKRFSNYISAKT